MKTFKALGLLLSYPKPEWLAHLDDLRLLLAGEGALPKKHLQAVLAFVDQLEAGDLFDLQEAYVETFDRGRAHSLHLFEHIHGDSRDRGQAMVDLAAAYEQAGLYIGKAELPDYLPLFLEFLSLQPPEDALELLAEPVDIIATIAGRLRDRHSPHATVFDALVALSRARPDARKVRQALERTPGDTNLDALDEEWAEAAAFDGAPQQAGCGDCGHAGNGLEVKITQ